MKDYSAHSDKWTDGTIVRQLGPLTYLLRTQDNRIVKRHTDQLNPTSTMSQAYDSGAMSNRGVDMTMVPVAHDHHQLRPLSVDPVEYPASKGEDPSCQDVSTDVTKKNVNTSILVTPAASGTVRRSTRMVRKPQKLDL